MKKKFLLFLLLSLLLTPGARAGDYRWEYKVIVVQGIAGGGSYQKQDGYYVDNKRTLVLNTLATDGWEVVSVIGSTTSEHTVYLRRQRDD